MQRNVALRWFCNLYYIKIYTIKVNQLIQMQRKADLHEYKVLQIGAKPLFSALESDGIVIA